LVAVVVPPILDLDPAVVAAVVLHTTEALEVVQVRLVRAIKAVRQVTADMVLVVVVLLVKALVIVEVLAALALTLRSQELHCISHKEVKVHPAHHHLRMPTAVTEETEMVGMGNQESLLFGIQTHYQQLLLRQEALPTPLLQGIGSIHGHLAEPSLSNGTLCRTRP
jgi:hypothetical protein